MLQLTSQNFDIFFRQNVGEYIQIYNKPFGVTLGYYFPGIYKREGV